MQILPKYFDLFDKNVQTFFSMSFECAKVVEFDEELGLRGLSDFIFTLLREGVFKKSEESVTTFYLGLSPPPPNCDPSKVREKNWTVFWFL